MSLSPAFLDELRSRTLLSGLIGKTVKLQRAGRESKACCPFHNEKTPSFTINDDKGFYHCFGCGAHGDAIRWLTEAGGLPFIDAVKELADAAGMEVPAPDPRAQQKAERAADLYDVMNAAQAWFVERLQGIEGGAARDYLSSRGISDATIRKFGFGFSPDSRGKLKSALASFGNDRLIEAGLLIAPEDGEREPYDRFRGRLMISIRDQRGRVIAFGGRILGSGEPKYLNSPETPLFDKGRTLYNLDQAAPASRDAKRVVVVEGYLDVIALDQAGFSEAVAPLGTALTEAQIERLWRLSNKPLLCFDGDTAGERAAVRAAKRALPHLKPGYSLGFINLPEGKDPDDLMKSGGRGAFAKFLSAPEELSDRLWRAEVVGSDATTPESRAGIKQRLLELAGTIEDRLVRDQYRQVFEDKFWSTFGWRKREVSSVSAEIAQSRKQARPGFESLVLRAVLLGLSRYPDVLTENLEAASKLPFHENGLDRWFKELSSVVLARPTIDGDLVEAILASADIPPIQKRDLQRDLAFSFFRKHDPTKGKQDLREVIGTLVAEQEVDRALAAAHVGFQECVENAEWEQVQRLIATRTEMRAQLSRFLEETAAAPPSPADAPAIAEGTGGY